MQTIIRLNKAMFNRDERSHTEAKNLVLFLYWLYRLQLNGKWRFRIKNNAQITTIKCPFTSNFKTVLSKEAGKLREKLLRIIGRAQKLPTLPLASPFLSSLHPFHYLVSPSSFPSSFPFLPSFILLPYIRSILFLPFPPFSFERASGVITWKKNWNCTFGYMIVSFGAV